MDVQLKAQGQKKMDSNSFFGCWDVEELDCSVPRLLIQIMKIVILI